MLLPSELGNNKEMTLIMKKDEILARAQKENRGKDEFDRELIEKGSVIGLIAGAVSVSVLTAVEFFATRNVNVGYFLIWFAMEAGLFIYKAVKGKKKHEILVAVIYSALFIMLLPVWILRIFKVI